ncbi:MAG: neutral zinc metallopeptidase [Gemmataceae bacterium]|nr:neutral zinc metallopeptidase [Gemmataceae bacterium]
MQWEGGEESSNVEDRRGMSGGKVAMAGGGGLLLLILGLVFGVDLGGMRGPGGGGGEGGGEPPDPRYKQFAGVILKSTEDVWSDQFANRANGYPTRRYEEPKFVLFTDAVRTGCGNAPAAVGPFYCPADHTLYLDPTFFDELKDKLGGSKAEFSQAYVIAHEVGHHVQNLLGYNDMVGRARRGGEEAGNEASVRLELMADYLAGVWAHQAARKRANFIEPGDFEEAITSAKAIGDDRLQKRSGGFVHPEKFTHGTSRQRVQFFTEGFKTGDASKERLDRFFTAPYRRGELGG